MNDKLLGARPLTLQGQMEFLAAHDLLALTVPVAYGGRGWPMAEAVRLTFAMARRNGSAGLTFAIHAGQIHTWGVHAKSDYLADQLRQLITSHRLVASVVSEPQTGGDIHKATATPGRGAGQDHLQHLLCPGCGGLSGHCHGPIRVKARAAAGHGPR